MIKLNTDIVRSNFPGLKNNWVFLDNAGGTQTARQVGDNINDYLFNSNVQLGASYEISQKAGKRVYKSQKIWAEAINASSASEVVFGSSTTALLQNLSISMVQQFKPGDEVIVTNSDHEANIGPWVSMERFGVIVKFWEINPETYTLELEDLAKLMSKNTKLVAFTHVSNILGTINPVEQITKFVHKHGALVCVDGVAYAPHRLVDVTKWDVDYYVFSLYKVYGPHYSILYGKKNHLRKLAGINHFFIDNNEVPYKLQPGNVNFELTYGSKGIIDYFDKVYSAHFEDASLPLFSKLENVFNLIATYEEELAKPLIMFLNNKKGVNIIGDTRTDKNIRIPTISFTIENRKSSQIPILVDPAKIGIRWGDFYARRLINGLNLSDKDGVIRASMVHYNTLEEVERLIAILDNIL